MNDRMDAKLTPQGVKTDNKREGAMKSLKMFFLQVGLCAMALLSAPSYAQPQAARPQEFRSGEIVVEMKPGASIDAINRRHRTATIERIYGTNFYRLRTPEGKDEERWRNRMSRDRDVLSASLNLTMVSPTGVFARAIVGFPGDRAAPGRDRAEYTLQPDLIQLLSLSDAQLRSRGAGVVVAIIDTGVDRSHPDLAPRLWTDVRRNGEAAADGVDDDRDGLVDDLHGWDFVDNDNDPTETAADPALSVAGHGTFIAGLIALVAPDCRIMPVRAFTPDGLGNAFTVAAAIKYAADHGANVINLSFGSPGKSGVVRDAIRYARQRGAVLVAAMGNEGEDTDNRPQYPANFGNVIGVAALDADSRKAGFSNFGSRVGVAALGVALVSTYPGVEGDDGRYAAWSGTSFAAPLTAAQAALLLAEAPGGDTRRTIEDTADDIDPLNPDHINQLGKGRINPLAALDSIYDATIPAGNYAYLMLVPGSGEALAQGQAERLVTGSLQQFRIMTRALNPRGRYRLVINGKDVWPEGFTANNFGGLAIEFASQPGSPSEPGHIRLELPGEFNPITNIRHVELRDGEEFVLRGDFTLPGGAADGYVTKRAPLTPTGMLPQAEGKVSVFARVGYEEIKVEGNKLTPGATYLVFADGVNLGSTVAQSAKTASGFLRLRASGQGVPPALRPVTRISRIEVRDLAGRAVLRGNFLPGGDS